ncbi:MAG: hypothetical protein MK364_22805, partial [Pirellulales bacterium]|nr:hypothetical protein [Pirellulales bacterium]
SPACWRRTPRIEADSALASPGQMFNLGRRAMQSKMVAPRRQADRVGSVLTSCVQNGIRGKWG